MLDDFEVPTLSRASRAYAQWGRPLPFGREDSDDVAQVAGWTEV